MYDEFNVVLKPKTIQNIKQKVIGKDIMSFTYNWYSIKTCCNLGLPRDEWKNTVELLDAFRERPGNVVKIVHDEDNEVVQIFIQSQEQRELFKKFGEVVEIDGTYKVDKAGMPLYTIVIEDNFGIGQPICYMFLREETTASIFAGLEIFAKVILLMKTKNLNC